MKLDWLIIGGGIHGVHIAARLLDELEVPREKLRILDPAEALLDRWRRCTETTGMTHLRSPSVHHLGLSPWSLQRFAGKKRRRKPGLFAHPYNRPALALFNSHCDSVIKEFGLDELHIHDRASHCSVDCGGVTVRTASGGEIEAQNVVLAIGASEQPRWPSWAPRDDERIQHVFEADFDGWPRDEQEVAVVGGGISAGQIALRLVSEGHRVHLVSRHELREHQFDSDPGWLGPKFMAGFARERDVNRRRVMIDEARFRGSVPPDVRRGLRRSIKAGTIHWHQCDVDELVARPTRLDLRLSEGTGLVVERVLLATGFEAFRPGGSMIDELVSSASLPCADCGYPIVDAGLRWHPRIHVTGPLAELELGPASRNIAGARHAGDRLVSALRSSEDGQSRSTAP